MRKFLFLLPAVILPMALWGIVFTSDKLEDFLSYVDQETCVAFDVDNTLIESSLHMGSVAWRDHIREKSRKAGFDKTQSELILDKFWNFVQPFIPVQVVDKKTEEVLRKLRELKVVVLALTAREPIEVEHTQKQLSSVKIHFSNDLFPDKMVLSTPFPCLYEKGVIYCGENKKSAGLLSFFQVAGFSPKKVIFIDDKAEQIQDVEKALEPILEYVGMRYGGADLRSQSFDAEIADLQWALLPRIVTDEEGSQILMK